jgi:N-acetylmuramoyl-L-alanine amidase CwlA
MNLIKSYQTKNACYAANVNKPRKPLGIVVHSTGAANPHLSRYTVGYPGSGLNKGGNDWDRDKPGGIEVSVNAFIGIIGTDSTAGTKAAAGFKVATVNTLPWDMKSWHSGSGSKGSAANANNNGYIGFEICEDDLTSKAYFDAVYTEAVELCAQLCQTYGIKPESPTLICHSEGNRLGIASNHADVMHWFPKFGKSMDTFRADVKAKLGNATSTVAATTPQTAVSQTPTTATFTPYTVRITAATLNYRSGGGTNYPVKGSVKKGEVYTIIEETNGVGATKWGKLKSGAGWLSLDYTVKA